MDKPNYYWALPLITTCNQIQRIQNTYGSTAVSPKIPDIECKTGSSIYVHNAKSYVFYFVVFHLVVKGDLKRKFLLIQINGTVE